MKKKVLCLIFIIVPQILLSWREETHRKITSYAFYNSKLPFICYLLNLEKIDRQILSNGSESNNIVEWIKKGVEKEDFWATRSMRHFHTPLKSFMDAGLINIFGNFQSSILWAQDGVEQSKFTEGDNSWNKIRSFFYNALISKSDSERQKEFALMFKGLGHQIHLIEDMANPEHTRNDNHPVATMEEWTENHLNEAIDLFWNLTPLFPTLDLVNPVNDSSTQRTLLPISRITDSDVYFKENPVPSESLEQGLAEYSSANFFSDDTICLGNFPNPTIPGDVARYVGNNKEYAVDEKGVYLKKRLNANNEINHFARIRYLEKYSPGAFFSTTLELDGACYNDYMACLIPRAVGYAAVLLDYFFRGEIEITMPPSSFPKGGIYAFCTQDEKKFNKITLMARNNMKNNEEMGEGQVFLVVRYRESEGDPFQLIQPKLKEEQKYIVVDYLGSVKIGRKDPTELTFLLPPESGLPVEAMDVNFTLVFKGKLGAETEAVAIGFKDVSEPTAIDIFNNTDKICFNGEYVNYNDPDLWSTVDLNPKNGKIDCRNDWEIDITRKMIKPMLICFNGQRASSIYGNFYYNFENKVEIGPGRSYRVYVLADAYPTKCSFSVLVHAMSLDNPVQCAPIFDNPVNSCDPNTNKLIWNNTAEDAQKHFYEHKYSQMGMYRDRPFWVLYHLDNPSVPSSSVCAISVSGESQVHLQGNTEKKNENSGNPITVSGKMKNSKKGEK